MCHGAEKCRARHRRVLRRLVGLVVLVAQCQIGARRAFIGNVRAVEASFPSSPRSWLPRGGRSAVARAVEPNSASPTVPALAAQVEIKKEYSSADERKLRSAIESIVRDQEELRTSAPLSGRTFFAACSTFTIAGLASIAAAHPILGAVLVPALTSGMFVYTSVAESSSTRSKGLARYNSGRAVGLAAQQETVLSTAEFHKAFLPFGVGLTAICAAACASVKIFADEVKIENPFLEQVSVSTAVFFAFFSIAGAIVTNDESLRMQTKLTPSDESPENEFVTEWEAGRLPTIAREPEMKARIFVWVLTVLVSLAALPIAEPDLLAFFAAHEERDKFYELAVIVSATAAAQAAFVFLAAETSFADAERRIAIQSKQAALAELFSAQAEAEAAIMPVFTATSGAALGAATLGVEFSRILAVLPAWPAMVGTLRSSLGAVMARMEADASRLELQAAVKGRGGKKNSDSVSSSFRELKRLQSEFGLGDDSDDARAQLIEIPVGQVKQFPSLSREARRQIHLVAAELGMFSWSVGNADKRVVTVTNMGKMIVEDPAGENIVRRIAESLREELQSLIAQGVPEESRPLALFTTATVLVTVLSPFVFGSIIAALAVPFVTGGVALQAVLQERVGKEAVADAKGLAASVLVRLAKAEVFVARAIMSYGAMPTDLAIVTFATTFSVIGFTKGGSPWLRNLASWPMLIAACIATAVAARRQRKIEKYICRAVNTVDGQPPDKHAPWKRWWILPVAILLLLPIDLPRRITVACACLVAETGGLIAVSSVQIASGEYHNFRCCRTFGIAEAWSQQALTAIRALPFQSAAATVTALAATALVTFSLPISCAFPIISLSVWFRALQFSKEAQATAAQVQLSCQSLQNPGVAGPWDSKEAFIDFGTGTQASGVPQDPVLPAQSTERPPQDLGRSDGGLQIWTRGFQRVIKIWEDASPETQYAPSPAEYAVRNVQSDLDEIRVSVRTYDRTWFQTFSVVGFFAAAAVIAPFFLSALATEVAVPVAGASLTLFAVAAESDARRSVATSKVWAAELKGAIGASGEVLAAATAPRSTLIAGCGVTCALAVVALVAEHPWNNVKAQHAFLLVLTACQVVAAASSIYPLRSVFYWTKRMRQITAASLRQGMQTPSIPPPGIASWRRRTWALLRGRARGDRRSSSLLMALLAALPPFLLAVFPRNRSFRRRAVAAGAAGAAIMTFALLAAEIACAQAERLLASRSRTYALTDAFSNEAEQQGALLPVASAATIAISGLITFVTELNPYGAAALAILQALTWVVASRKAVATRFESDAAMQVGAVTGEEKLNFWRYLFPWRA